MDVITVLMFINVNWVVSYLSSCKEQQVC